MKIQSLKLKDDIGMKAVAGSNVMLLLGIKPSFLYENGKITEEINGYVCECVCVDNGYEKLNVKTTIKPVIAQEQIDNSEAPIRVSFENFEAKVYKDFRNNDYALSCKAKLLILMK